MTQPYNDDQWYCRRACHRDIFGEYYASDSWTCERRLNPVVQVTKAVRFRVLNEDFDDYVEHHPYLRHDQRIKMTVNVMGRYDSKGRLRPKTWYAYLSQKSGPNLWRPKPDDAWRGTCTSIIDARRQAHQLVTPEVIAQFLSKVYDPRLAIRVYRKVEDPDVVPPDFDDWEPYVTVFGRYITWQDLPVGEYMAVSYSPGKGLVARSHKRTRWGHTSTGFDGPVRLWWGPIPKPKDNS